MKHIRVKETGVETVVPDEYFKKYEKEGWFIEIVEKKVVPKKATKVEAPAKEE